MRRGCLRHLHIMGKLSKEIDPANVTGLTEDQLNVRRKIFNFHFRQFTEKELILQESSSLIVAHADIIKQAFVNTRGLQNAIVPDPVRELATIDFLFLDIIGFIVSLLSFSQLTILIYMLLGNLILTSILKILVLKYGNYLIIRYNLESKHPMLARLIKNRVTCFKYTLIFYSGVSLTSLISLVYFQYFM